MASHAYSFGYPRPAETYRANKPSKVKGRGSFNRQVAAQRKAEAETAERGKVVTVGYNAMHAVTSGSDNVVLVRKEADAMSEHEARMPLSKEVSAELTHEAKLAKRREHDRAKRAAAKAGTVAVIDGGATGMVLRSLAAQGHI